MKRNIQMVHTYRCEASKVNGKPSYWDEMVGRIKTEVSSFNTLEKAIEKAYFWINKEEPWIDTTVVQITIINKETKEILWSYKEQEL